VSHRTPTKWLVLPLVALEAGHFGSRNRPVPEPADERLQFREDMDAVLAHLREVRDKYWDHDWRRAHRGYGRYPETEVLGVALVQLTAD